MNTTLKINNAPLMTLIALCFAVCAAEKSGAAAKDELLDLSLEELLKIKITSSTLTEESLQSVPSSMTVYTRADIHRLGLQNLPQLINLIPGFQSYRSDSFSLNYTMSSRGRRLNGSSVEILILIDGQRLNNDWNGGAGQDDSLISLENVERVEFIRGPGSAIYGSNALMGVINIITGSARELVVETGSHQKHHTSLQWHAQNEIGKVDMYFSRTQSDGEQVTLFEPFPNPATPVTINSRTPFVADDVYIRAEVSEFSLSLREAARDMRQFYVTGYIDQNTNAFITESNSVNIGWQHLFKNDLSLTGHIFHSHKNFEIRTAPLLIPYFVLEGGIEEQELGTQWLLQGNQEHATWLLGWEWRKPELVDTSAHYGPQADPFLVVAPQAPTNDRTINGLFAQFQWALTDTLKVTTGLRHDEYSDVGGHLSPRFGLVKKLEQGDTFKILYSEAFRAPNRIETSVINSPAFQNNPKLKPETAKTSELVWLHLLDTGYVSSTLFNTKIKDAIEETVTP